MILRGKSIIVLLLAGLAAASAREPRQDWAGIHDSLREIEPWFRRRWLSERRLQDYYKQMSWKPDSQGITCVGRWSYGPSVKVSLRVTPDDTVICLARGSGASLIQFRSHDSLELQLLSDINCYGILSRAIIKDTLVYCGMSQGGTGIEIYGVSNLAFPHLLSRIDLPPIMDIALQDTFLYAIGYQQDSLRVFNVADPRNPEQVGACADSGFPTCISGDYCYLSGQYGLNIIDVSNPRNPHRAGSIGGYEALSVAVRDTLCFFGTAANGLQVYNVKNPATPIPVGSLDGIQPAGLYLPPTCDTVLYTPKFDIIGIADPRHPRLVGHVEAPGWDYGVRAVPALNYALVADYFEGLVAIDITSPSTPRIDTMLFAGDMVEDICIDSERAYLASYHAGMQILDVAEPSMPLLIGSCDSVGRTRTSSVVARDSFAFMTWLYVPFFRSVDVSDPQAPRVLGGYDVPNYPEDMVLRDSFCYIAENRRFQILNVARPREPELVGSCELPFDSWKALLQDTLAFVANVTSLKVINVARPDNPAVVGGWNGRTLGIDLQDTLAFTASSYYGCVALSIADQRAPYTLDSLPLDGWMADVVVIDTLAYVGGSVLYVVNVADPRNLRPVGNWTPPRTIRRLLWEPPYIYAACYEGGICILETLQTAISEPHQPPPRKGRLRVWPSVTASHLSVELPALLSGARLELYSVAGNRIKNVPIVAAASSETAFRYQVDMKDVPDGVYVLSVKVGNKSYTTKVVKTPRR